jgi:hypothetical protein
MNLSRRQAKKRRVRLRKQSDLKVIAASPLIDLSYYGEYLEETGITHVAKLGDCGHLIMVGYEHAVEGVRIALSFSWKALNKRCLWWQLAALIRRKGWMGINREREETHGREFRATARRGCVSHAVRIGEA